MTPPAGRALVERLEAVEREAYRQLQQVLKSENDQPFGDEWDQWLICLNDLRASGGTPIAQPQARERRRA